MSICESKGTGTRLLQPFLLDATSLSLAPELSQVGRVEEQDSLHIPRHYRIYQIELWFCKGDMRQ